MPENKKRKQIVVTVTEEQEKEFLEAMNERGFKNKTDFMRTILQFYLTVNKINDEDSAILGQAVEGSIARAFTKIKKELEKKDQQIDLLLNLLWHRLNYDGSITEDELLRMIKDAATEANAGIFDARTLLTAAKTERENYFDGGSAPAQPKRTPTSSPSGGVKRPAPLKDTTEPAEPASYSIETPTENIEEQRPVSHETTPQRRRPKPLKPETETNPQMDTHPAGISIEQEDEEEDDSYFNYLFGKNN